MVPFVDCLLLSPRTHFAPSVTRVVFFGQGGQHVLLDFHVRSLLLVCRHMDRRVHEAPRGCGSLVRVLLWQSCCEFHVAVLVLRVRGPCFILHLGLVCLGVGRFGHRFLSRFGCVGISLCASLLRILNGCCGVSLFSASSTRFTRPLVLRLCAVQRFQLQGMASSSVELAGCFRGDAGCSIALEFGARCDASGLCACVREWRAKTTCSFLCSSSITSVSMVFAHMHRVALDFSTCLGSSSPKRPPSRVHRAVHEFQVG